MMSAFFQQGFRQYRRHQELRKNFADQTARLNVVLGQATQPMNYHNRWPLFVVLPLVEVAWADGHITRREMDAIVQVAEVYGLVDDATGYGELLERLVSRPTPDEVGRVWQDFHILMGHLTESECATVTFALLTQAQFVAEQGADSVIGFLRGEEISPDAQDAWHIVAAQLEQARGAAAAQEIPPAVAARHARQTFYFGTATDFAYDAAESGSGWGAMRPSLLPTDAQLIPLVPLVKVAWAEGRITRRERELIFQAAARLGIEAGSAAHERLAAWLELHPTDDFYHAALELLNARWDNLTEEEKSLRRLDLLSDCVNIAEASGGTPRYPAGGRRICDEEFLAVTYIAAHLNAPSTVALA